MRTLTYTILLTLLIHGTAWGQAAQEPEPAPGVILVKFAPGTLHGIKQQITPQDLRAARTTALRRVLRFQEGRKIFRDFRPADTLATTKAGRRVRLLDLSRWYTLKEADTTNIPALAERLARLPGVEAASPEFALKPHHRRGRAGHSTRTGARSAADRDTFSVNFPTPIAKPRANDPRFQQGDQWGLYNDLQPGNDIHAKRAWFKNRGRNDVTVAVVDGGVDYTHPDLDPGDRSREALEDVGTPVPSPASSQLVQSRETENADQLYLMNSEGENVRRITDLGGDNPRWSYDGSYFTFRRDVHEGEGARYIPFRFDMSTMEAEPLFATQPDSLPQFPPLSEAPNLMDGINKPTPVE